MNRYKIIGLSLSTALILTQTACLKDKPGTTDPAAGTNSVVEFQNSSVPVSYTAIFPQYANSINYPAGIDTGGFNVNFNYAGDNNGTPEDIKITIAIDTASLTAFNNDQQTSLTLPPADVFSIGTTITIPKGTRDAHLRPIITLAPDFDYTATYALPLKITSASYGIVSTNFGTAIYSFLARNKYDGDYSLNEKLVGWGTYGIADGVSYAFPNNIGFVTSGQFTNTTYDPKTWGVDQLAFVPGGGTTAFGATNPQFTWDAAADTITDVVNLAPNDGRGRAFSRDSSVTSYYDPASKTIYATYWMYQSGRPRQHIYDTLVYQGVR